MNEKVDETLNQKITEALLRHPATERPWAVPVQHLPGMWVFSLDSAGEPYFVEYKNFNVYHYTGPSGSRWIAYYYDEGHYPDIVGPNFQDRFVAATLEEIYAMLVELYKIHEPITSEEKLAAYDRSFGALDYTQGTKRKRNDAEA